MTAAVAGNGGNMPIETIFANVSCSDLAVSEPWYEKLFGRAADRHPMAGLAEWHFTDSAEVQLYQDAAKAGHSTLALEVMPLGAERVRLVAAGIEAGEIEAAKDFYILRLRDPDANLVVLAAAEK
jgi:hypothetical protein